MDFDYFQRLFFAPTEPPISPSKHPLSPNSPLSDPPPPPLKRRRADSESSLSEPDDEDDEDQPLASRIPRTSSATNGINGQRSGKKPNGKTFSGKKGPAPSALGLPLEQAHSASEGATMNGRVNGVVPHDPPVKVEVDDKQLSRLATGVTVDTGNATAQTPVSHTPSSSSTLIQHANQPAEHLQTGKGSVWRASRRNHQSRRGGKRQAAAITDHSHRPEDALPETTTKDASGIHCAIGLRHKFESIGHHQAWL